MPAKPIAPMPSACHTGNRLKARSSASGLALGPSACTGNHKASSSDRGDGDDRHRGVDPAPVEHLPGPGRQRIADEDRQRQPQHDDAHRAAAPMRRADRHRGQCRDAEISAVRQPGDETEQQHAVIGRPQCAGQVAQRVEAHQRQQQGLAPPARAKDGQQRRADHYAQRVGTDQVAHLRLGHAQRRDHVRHQPHAGELAGADGESTEGQGEQDQPDLARRQVDGRNGNRVAVSRRVHGLIVLRAARPSRPALERCIGRPHQGVHAGREDPVPVVVADGQAAFRSSGTEVRAAGSNPPAA